MKIITIAIGADHRGYAMKEHIKKHVPPSDVKIIWHDVGAHSTERSDYPVFGNAVAQEILQEKAQCGILLCGSGVGMSIIANRFEGIYAGLVWNPELASASRADDNTNVLVLPADFITNDHVIKIVHVWLATSFKGGRYQERLDMIDALAE